MEIPDPRPSGSVTRSILAKQPRVLLFYPQDADGITLLSQLRRIGCVVQTCWPPTTMVESHIDIIFLFMQPEIDETNYEWLRHNPPPIISVSNFETPAIIDEALRIGVMGMLSAPVRSSGLLSSLVMALTHDRKYAKSVQRINRLEERFSSFRIVEEAKAVLLRLRGFAEAEAYELLRTQAQERRVSVESVAKDLIHAAKLLNQSPGAPPRKAGRGP